MNKNINTELRNNLIRLGLKYTEISTGAVLTAPRIEVYLSDQGTVYVNSKLVPLYEDVVPQVIALKEKYSLNVLENFRSEVGDEAFMLYSISSMLALANTLDYHVVAAKEDKSGRLKKLFLTKYEELKNKCSRFNQYFQQMFNLKQHDALEVYSKQLYEINICLGLMDPRDRDEAEVVIKGILKDRYTFEKFKIEN